MAGFRYIIQTELQLNAASLNKILSQVTEFDREIQQRTKINLNVRLNNNAKQTIQREIGNLKATLPVHLRLDNSSVAIFKRQVDAIIGNAKREIEVAIRATNNQLPSSPSRGSSANGSPSRLPMPGAAVGQTNPQLQNLTQKQINEMNAQTSRIKALNKQLEDEVKEQIKAEKLKTAELRRQAAEESRRGAAAAADKQEIWKQKKELELESKRATMAQQRLTAQQREANKNPYHDTLMNPDASMAQKQAALRGWDSANARAARQTGTAGSASFTYRTRDPLTGAVTQVRTLTREYDRFGNAVNRADKSLSQMATNVSRQFMFHTAIAAGFYKIAEGAMASVQAMKDFEAEMTQIENLNVARRNEAPAGTLPKNLVSTTQAGKDVFGLAKRYGRDPLADVMPIYTEMLRRSDIAPTQSAAKDLTQLVIRGGIVAKGSEADSGTFNSMSTDMLGIMQSMNPVWQRHKKDPARQMSKFIDELAVMKDSGAQTDVILDAMGNGLTSFTNGEAGSLSMTSLAALIGSTSKAMGDASGSEVSTVLRGLLTNLGKTSGNPAEASEMLGFGNYPDMPLQVRLDALTKKKRFMGLDDKGQPMWSQEQIPQGEMRNITRDLASTGGAGGTAAFSKYSQVINNLPVDYEKYKNIDPNTADGRAEQVAKANSEKLAGLLGKLNAQFKEMAVLLGASGVLDGLKGITKAVTAMTSGLTGLFAGLAYLNNMLHKTFGDEIGTAVNSLMTLGLGFAAFKGAKKLLFDNKKGGFAGDIVADTLLGGMPGGNGGTPNGARRGRGRASIGRELFEDVAGMDAYGGINRSSSRSDNPDNLRNRNRRFRPDGVPFRRPSRVGGILNWVTGVGDLGQMASGGTGRISTWAAGTARGAAAAEGGAGKLGIVFKALLGPLGKFAMILTRLSVWGAAIGLVAWGIKALWDKHQAAVKATATKTTSALKDDSISSVVVDNFKKVVELQNQVRTNPNGIQGDVLMQRNELFNNMNNALASKGGKLSFDATGQSSLKITGPTGDTKKYNFGTTDQDLQNLVDLTESLNTNLDLGEYRYQKQNAQLVDQITLLSQIKNLTDTMDRRASYEDVANKFNNIQFQGSTDSFSYLTNSLNIINKTMGGLEGDLNTVASQKYLLAKQQSQNDSFTEKQKGVVGDAKWQDIYNGFIEAAKDGSDEKLDAFKQKYVLETTGDTETDTKNQQSYDAASALYSGEKTKRQIEVVAEEHKKIVDTLNTEISKYKELYTNMLVASSGVQVLEGAMKGLSATLAGAKMNFALAVGDDSRISASGEVFKGMATQTKLYAQELDGLQSAMTSLVLAHPDQDFSMGKLYSPDQNGITSEQTAFRQMLEKQGEVTENYNQSLESLKEQADTMVDLVMATSKYKTMWDSVNDRIEMSKNLAGEIRAIQTSSKVAPIVSGLKQTLFGSSFNAGNEASQAAAGRRDSYVSMYEKIQGAIVTYGDDAKKLKEAIADVEGNLGDKLDAALVNPLKDIIDKDLQSAALKQLEASNTFKNSVDVFQRILDAEAENAGLNAGNFSSDEKSQILKAYFGDMPQGSSMMDSAIQGMVQKYGSEDAAYSYMKNAKTPDNSPDKYDGFINKASLNYGVDANLIKAIIKAESSFNPNAESSAGAQGLMQLMPGTAKGLGVTDSFDPEQNIMGGVKHLAGLLAKYDGDVTNALMAYNAGGGRMDKVLAGKATVPEETAKYAPKVLGYAEAMGYVVSNNKATVAGKDNDEALKTDKAKAMDAKIGSLREQVKYLASNGISSSLGTAQKQAETTYGITGSKLGYKNSYFSNIQNARMEVAGKQEENSNTLASYKAAYADPGTSKELKVVYKELIKSLVENGKSLDKLAKDYKAQAYKDPQYNTTEAKKSIQNREAELNKLKNSGQAGGVEWYKILEDINSMYANFSSSRKNADASAQGFANNGQNYDRVVATKEKARLEDVQLIQKQIVAIGKEMTNITAGTNKWYTVVEDYVGYQQKILDMENKKTELAKKYFEMTGKGQAAYINARAYTQSRDYVQTKTNRDNMIQKYQTSSGSQDGTEQLVNLQIISEAHNSMIGTMNEYREAVTGAFRAGAISLEEYMKRMNNLRDMQNEIKENAITMADSMKQSFSSSLSGAIKEGMQGSFDAPQDFLANMKDGIASAVSSQMSNIVLQQSGLGDVMNNLIASMVGSMTSGSANDSVNGFNNNDFASQIDAALAPFLPLIEQITQSTDGIFGILKDQTFNAPGGFKIDSYLYEIEKARSATDLGSWYTSNPTNEAGSPLPGTGSGGAIVLPPMANVPTGVPSTVTTPIESVTAGANIVNPVKQALEGILDMKTLYGDKGGGAGDADANKEANKIRDALSSVAGGDKILEKIGNDTKGMDAKQLAEYLKNTDLSQFDMVEGIDTSNSILQSVVDGIGAVHDAIVGKQAAAATPASGGSTGGSSAVSTPATTGVGGAASGGTTSTTKTTTTTLPANTGSLGNNGVGTAADMKANIDKLKTDSSFVDAEKARAAEVIAARTKAGLDTSAQEKYLDSLNTKYHTGGIGGFMNFSKGNSLRANEFNAILQNDETIFQKGQLGSFMSHFMETGGITGKGNYGGGGGTNVNVNVQVSGAGSDQGIWEEAMNRAVTAAVNEVQRQGRLSNLRNKGVAY